MLHPLSHPHGSQNYTSEPWVPCAARALVRPGRDSIGNTNQLRSEDVSGPNFPAGRRGSLATQPSRWDAHPGPPRPRHGFWNRYQPPCPNVRSTGPLAFHQQRE